MLVFHFIFDFRGYSRTNFFQLFYSSLKNVETVPYVNDYEIYAIFICLFALNVQPGIGLRKYHSDTRCVKLCTRQVKIILINDMLGNS